MKIKVCEIFESIQGEGKYAGYPMLFIRLSGCTRTCPWCDTKYHNKGEEMDIEKLVEIIKNSKKQIICWTGGEPLLQLNAIEEAIRKTFYLIHHVETNGDLLKDKEDISKSLFSYIACSPKDREVAERIYKFKELFNKYLFTTTELDIKVVTDMEKEGMDMLEYADYLMPLTSYNKNKDLEVMKKVWDCCVNNNKKLILRYQTIVWGKKKGI